MPARIVVVDHEANTRLRAQLAPVLVGHDVVRVVGPGAEVLEVAERLAIGKAAERRPVLSVRQRRAARERPCPRRRGSSSACGRDMSTVVAVGAMTIVAGSTSTM